MVSPEVLRSLPFLSPFNNSQLRLLSTIANEGLAAEKEILFEECQPAAALYLLVDGSLDLYYKPEEEYDPKEKQAFAVGKINPGEAFGFNSLIEPHIYNATARAAKPSRYIIFNASKMRELFAQEPATGYFMMQQVARALMERLAHARYQFAAAWA